MGSYLVEANRGLPALRSRFLKELNVTLTVSFSDDGLPELTIILIVVGLSTLVVCVCLIMCRLVNLYYVFLRTFLSL